VNENPNLAAAAEATITGSADSAFDGFSDEL
jgi:hypothetical protein